MNPMRSVTWGDTWEVTGRDLIQADQSHFVFYAQPEAPTAVNGDVKSIKKTPFPPFSFNGECTLNLAIWQTETYPLLIDSIMCQY